MYFLSKSEGGRAKPILNKYMQMIYIDTWFSVFRLDLLEDSKMIMPGEQVCTHHMFSRILNFLFLKVSKFQKGILVSSNLPKINKIIFNILALALKNIQIKNSATIFY